MKVANEIGHPWKYFCNRRDNPSAHIMDKRLWFTVLLFDTLKKGDKQFLLL
jgi:hypothetical protein